MGLNYIKAGPIDRTATLEYLSKNYDLDALSGIALLDAANASSTGMALRHLTDGRCVWVSALVTMPGKYMIEVE